jgi:NADH:quinone reductase (non-electrogenic)
MMPPLHFTSPIHQTQANTKMVLTTKITKLLNIKHPIIQGGMHHVGFAGLAAAVANAGGLGLVTALTQPSPELLAQEIDKAQMKLRPDAEGQVGVNLTILPMFAEVDYDGYKVRVEWGGGGEGTTNIT